MINKPDWLPDTISLSDCDFDWKKYLGKLFEIFKNDFINSRLLHNCKPILFDNRQINNYPACFWHLITEDKIKGFERLSEENVSLLRCERVCWIRPIIENCGDQAVSVWENERKGKVNTVFFLENFDYVVILTNVKNKFFLVTAYFINYPYRKRQLIKERDKWIEMQKPPQNGTV